jgi:hypothetical protein
VTGSPAEAGRDESASAVGRMRGVPGGGVLPRRFLLVRRVGVAAFGVRWPDGAVALHWRPGRRPAGETGDAVYGHVSDVEAAYGHGGSAVVEWVD